MDRLIIKDIRFTAHCGITEEERRYGQGISADVEVTLDLSKATDTDRLEDTVDYVKIGKRVIATGEKGEYNLIETMAERICRDILNSFNVSEVFLRIRKYPESLDWIKGCFEVEMRRKRG